MSTGRPPFVCVVLVVINVSAQADHPLFVWSLLLLKSENQFFFFLLYRRITGEPEAEEERNTAVSFGRRVEVLDPEDPTLFPEFPPTRPWRGAWE